MCNENRHIRRMAYGAFWLSVLAAVLVLFVLMVTSGALVFVLAVLFFGFAYGVKYALGWVLERLTNKPATTISKR